MGAAEQPLRITPDMLLSRRVDFERRMRRLPPVTLGLIAFLIVVFLGEIARDAFESEQAMVAAGALDATLVRAGEYWRILSATFLHGSVDHLLGNSVALLVLGMIGEHAYGRRQFVLLYVASAVAGSLVSLVTSTAPSVGASGAIFGLQGAAIMLFRRHRDRLLVRDRRIGLVLLAWALYTIGSGLLTPWIDNGAHIGGVIGGALVGRSLHPIVLDPIPPAHEARVRRLSWVAWIALAYTAIGWLVR
jgi:rhomboid protease GluP